MGSRKRRPRCRKGSRPSPWDHGPPQRVARAKGNAPPAMEMGTQRRTPLVTQPATPKLPKIPRAEKLAAVFLRRAEMGGELEASSPRAKHMGETPRAAAERPSSRGDPDTPLVVAGRSGQEAVSWVCAPRPSAGRPRKVSL